MRNFTQEKEIHLNQFNLIYIKKINNSIKQKNLNVSDKACYLFIFNNINLKNNEIVKVKKKAKGEYNIPVLFNNYCKNSKLNINIAINYKNILYKESNYIYYLIYAEKLKKKTLIISYVLILYKILIISFYFFIKVIE